MNDESQVLKRDKRFVLQQLLNEPQVDIVCYEYT